MADSFLIKRGGSVEGEYALIHVIYPVGNSCVCSDGKKILRAEDTSGDWTVGVPYAGTWTVTSTDGVTPDNQTVVVSQQWTVYEVIMSPYYLYKDGVYSTPQSAYGGNVTNYDSVLTNGTATDESTYIYLKSTNAKAVFNLYKRWNWVDLTPWNTITLNIDGWANGGGDFERRIWVTKDSSITYGGNATYKTDTYSDAASWTNFTQTLDISDVTGRWLVGVGTDSRNSSWTNKREGKIHSVCLSR